MRLYLLGTYAHLIAITILLMHVYLFERTVRKIRSTPYKDDAEETRTTEIKRVKGMSLTLIYSGSKLISGSRCGKAIRKIQVGQ